MNKYAVFLNTPSAQAAIKQINEVKGWPDPAKTTKTWAQPILHPIQLSVLVDYDDAGLADCQHAFNGVEIITEQEAVNRGWYLGFFKGRFGKARAKLEECQILFDCLKSNYGRVPFPVSKAFLFGFTSGCYSIKETLKKLSTVNDEHGTMINPRCPNGQAAWWKSRWKNEINKQGELLHYFNCHINNADKHDTAVYLKPTAIYNVGSASVQAEGNQFLEAPGGLILGSEGVFETQNAGTQAQRRVVPDLRQIAGSYGIKSAGWYIEFIGLPTMHLCQPLKSTEFIEVTQIVLDYYEKLVFEGESLFPG